MLLQEKQYSLSFTSVRKERSLEKIHLSMRNGAYNSKLDDLLLVFNEHDKDIKYTWNIFHV